jgi:putative hydroxymethylpyrimidine transport system permease protein
MKQSGKKESWGRQHGPAVLLALALIAVWQIAAMAVNIPHIFPSPWAVLQRTWELRETLLLHHLPYTLEAVFSGWGLAIVVGVLLAIVMDASPKAEAMLYPVMTVTQTVPVMCISPLFVLWFGYTLGARLLAVVLSTFFAIALNTYDGLRDADPEKKELMTACGASRKEILFKLKIPSAFPLFLTSLKMTFPWAVIDAAVAEWLGSTRGLGYFSKRMVSRMDGPGVFAPVLILCLAALLGFELLKIPEKKYAFYRNEL